MVMVHGDIPLAGDEHGDELQTSRYSAFSQHPFRLQF